MRHIIRCISLILVLASIGLIGVSAQSPAWEAWMYNSENGRMIRIGSDRSVYDDFTLPGLQGNFYSYQVAVSPDGRIILYTLTNQNNGIVSVYAYDTIVNAIAASYIIPSQQGQLVYTNIDLSEAEEIFSPDGTSVAIGYTIDGEWSIVVMDLFGTPGNISQQLNKSDPAASSVVEIGLDVPVIMNYDGFVIDFVIIPAATEASPLINITLTIPVTIHYHRISIIRFLMVTSTRAMVAMSSRLPTSVFLQRTRAIRNGANTSTAYMFIPLEQTPFIRFISRRIQLSVHPSIFKMAKKSCSVSIVPAPLPVIGSL